MGQLVAYEKVEALYAIGEGEIQGPWTGDLLKDVYLDKTPVKNDDGSFNFRGVTLDWRPGSLNQTYMPGFDFVSNEVNVASEIGTSTPTTRQINEPCDRITVKLAWPNGLRRIDGDKEVDATVYYKIDLSISNGPFVTAVSSNVSGQSSGYFSKAHTLNIIGSPPYKIRVIRLSSDNLANPQISDRMAWASYDVINDVKLNYPHTALIGFRADAVQFNRGLPSILFRAKGIKIRVPSNYNPESRTYTGVWNGSFIIRYTNNPAWILYDLIVEDRYGLGNYINPARIDKWALYKIAKYCDEFIPDGLGHYEPRFVCNPYIVTQEEAFKVLNNILSAFRGMNYYTGGSISFSQDTPSQSPAKLFTDANVVTEYGADGAMSRPPFSYKSSDLAVRHTVGIGSYQNFSDFDAPVPIMVEDLNAIDKYGYRPTDVSLFGCSSPGQAQRAIKWLLVTELLEREIVTFEVGREGLLDVPGDIIKIADAGRAKQRFSGRIAASTISTITMDAPKALLPGKSYFLSVLLPVFIDAIDQNGAAYSKEILREFVRRVVSPPGTQIVLTFTPNLPSPPPIDTIWMLAGDVQPQLFRAVSISEAGNGRYGITATAHNPAKFGHADTPGNLNINTNINLDLIPEPPTNIKLEQINDNYFTVSWLPSKTAGVKLYRIEYQKDSSGVWILAEETQSTSIQSSISPGFYSYRVAAIDIFGKQSLWSNVDGTTGELIATSGRILAYYNDGAIRLDNKVKMIPGNTYELETLIDQNGWKPTRRRIVYNPGRTDRVSVSPPFVGASNYYRKNQPVLDNVDGKITYLEVTGGNVTCYSEQNYTGTSQIFTPGFYRGDRDELAIVGNRQIRSIQVPLGASVFCSEYEVGRNPQFASAWKIYDLGDILVTSGFIVAKNGVNGVVLDGYISQSPTKHYELSAMFDGISLSRRKLPDWINGFGRTRDLSPIIPTPNPAGFDATYYASQPTLGNLDLRISYLYVTGFDIIIYAGQNYTGASAILTPGFYRADRQEIPLGNDAIRSIYFPGGSTGSVYVAQNEVGQNPPIGTPWQIFQVP